MPHSRFLPPDPASLIATRDNPPLKLYAYLARVPLFATVRIIGPAIPERRARSYWLGWIIDDQRWARSLAVRDIPPAILDWAALHVAEAYPSVADAAGLTEEEIAGLRAAQSAKRAKFRRD